VDVQFTPLAWEGHRWRSDSRAFDYTATIVIPLSINLWPDLRIGTFWKQGVRCFPDAGDIIDIAADVEPSNLRLNHAYDSVEPGRALVPPFEHRLHDSMAGTNILRVAVDGLGNLREVDIPCTEIFRAYYGQSSRLAYHLLTGAFVGNRYNRIYNPEESWCNESECFVQLGSRIRNADALVVSRLAFDPIANANAKRIVADTIAAGASNDSYALACCPPFESTTVWSARGKYVDNGRRFLVWEILRCTAPFPARNVRRGRDNQNIEGGQAPARRLLRTEVKNTIEQVVLEAGNPRSDLVPAEIDIPGSPIFSQVSLVSDPDASTAPSALLCDSECSSYATGESQSNGSAPVDIVRETADRDELFFLQGRLAAIILISGEILSGTLRIRHTPEQLLALEMNGGEVRAVPLSTLRSLELLPYPETALPSNL